MEPSAEARGERTAEPSWEVREVTAPLAMSRVKTFLRPFLLDRKATVWLPIHDGLSSSPSKVGEPLVFAAAVGEPELTIGGTAVAAAGPLGRTADHDQGFAVGGVGRLFGKGCIGHGRGAAGDGDGPQLWHPADPHGAIGNEENRCSIGCEVEGSIGHRGVGETGRRRAAVGRHDENVRVAVSIGREGDGSPIPRPDRVAFVGRVGCDASCIASGCGNEPQVTLPGEDDLRSVRRWCRIAGQGGVGGQRKSGDDQGDTGGNQGVQRAFDSSFEMVGPWPSRLADRRAPEMGSG